MDAREKLILTVLAAFLLVFGTGAVAFADVGCVESLHDIDITPSSLVSPPGETAVFVIEVENEDSDNCPIKQFTFSATSTAGFSFSFRPSSLLIEPEESDTTLMKVSVPSSTAASTYEIKAFVHSGTLTRSKIVNLEVREEIEECTVKVSNLRFKETNADDFESEFSNDDEVSVFVDVSLIGNAASQIILELFADGSLIDSETDLFSANSDTTFRFGNRILTKNYDDDIDVKVVATPFCNPDETDETDDEIEIEEMEDDIDVEIDVGTPGNTVVGREVTSRIFAENNGAKDVRINVDAFLCRVGVGCNIEMNCDDSIILVEDDDTEEVICRATPREVGTYRVDAHVSLEDDEDVERSRSFFVYVTEEELRARTPTAPTVIVSTEEQRSAEKVVEVNYVCSGSLRQAVYKTTEGVKVTDVEFCPFGCSLGRCLTTPAGSGQASPTPSEVETPRPIFAQPQYNPPVFDLNNFIDWLKNLLFSQPS